MMGGMMLSCDKATTLVEKKIDVGLTFMERLNLKFHLSMCSACKNYQEQSILIHRALQKHLEDSESISSVVSPQIKAEILNRLRKNR